MCIALRRSCSDTPNTCGSCVSSLYTGESGSSNVPCVAVASFTAKQGSGSSAPQEVRCAVDADCGTWKICRAGLCEMASKACTGNCSDHGSCQYRNQASGALVTDCKISDNSCTASCRCFSGYSGALCDLSAAAMFAKQSVRETLLSVLRNVTNTENPSKQSVSSWVGYLGALVSNAYELNDNSLKTATAVATAIISNSRSLKLSAESTASLLPCISAISSGFVVQQSKSQGSRRLSQSAAVNSSRSSVDYSSAALQTKTLLQGYR